MKNKKIKMSFCLFLAMMVSFTVGCSKAGETEGGTEGTATSSPVSGKTVSEEEAILTVGDYTYRLEDMMYYIYIQEEMGWQFNEIFGNFSDESGEDYNYWEDVAEEEDEEIDEEDKEKGEKLTGEESSKESVILAAKKDLVWYQEALKRGITLEEEDKTSAKSAYDSFCEDLTDKQKNTAGMGQELLDYFEKQEVIEKYKESLLEEAEFDEEKASASVSAEENREYVFEYFEIYKTDENGKAFSKNEMKEYLNELKKLAKKLDKDSDMENMIPKKYQDYILYSDGAFSESEDGYYEKYKKVDIDEELKKLKNGEVSQIFETKDSYFVARMRDNNSMEYYEELVMDAVETAKSEVYDKAYENALDNYTIVLHEDNWADVTLGNLIYEYEGDA